MEIHKELRQFGRVRVNAPLAKYSAFKIGGPAEFLVEVTETARLVALLNFLSGEGIDFLILGGGCNVLLPDEGWRGVVVKMSNVKCQMSKAAIEAEAGAELGGVLALAIQNNLTGLEWAAGIPGTLGGAIRGNAGARYEFTGGEIKDSVTTVTVWRDGEVLVLAPPACAFGYRESIFKHNRDVVLGATFDLNPGAAAESLRMTQKIIAERRGKQSSAPSAGSFFKNVMLSRWKRDPAELPERFRRYQKIAAGWLVEQAGLKGYRVGGAAVSAEHGNFIINLGGATQADVLAIVEEVKAKVYNSFEVELEEEVMVVR